MCSGMKTLTIKSSHWTIWRRWIGNWECMSISWAIMCVLRFWIHNRMKYWCKWQSRWASGWREFHTNIQIPEIKVRLCWHWTIVCGITTSWRKRSYVKARFISRLRFSCRIGLGNMLNSMAWWWLGTIIWTLRGVELGRVCRYSLIIWGTWRQVLKICVWRR